MIRNFKENACGKKILGIVMMVAAGGLLLPCGMANAEDKSASMSMNSQSMGSNTASKPADPFANDFLYNWDPATEMERMQRLFERAMSSPVWARMGAAHRGLAQGWNLAYNPSIDLDETDSQFILRVDLPGMQKDQIDIEVKDQILTVSGERSSDYIQSGAGEDGQFYRRERGYGHFSRSVELPSNAKTNEVNAKYEQGVLTVNIGKDTPVKPKTKAIKVKVQ